MPLYSSTGLPRVSIWGCRCTSIVVSRAVCVCRVGPSPWSIPGCRAGSPCTACTPPISLLTPNSCFVISCLIEMWVIQQTRTAAMFLPPRVCKRQQPVKQACTAVMEIQLQWSKAVKPRTRSVLGRQLSKELPENRRHFVLDAGDEEVICPQSFLKVCAAHFRNTMIH